MIVWRWLMMNLLNDTETVSALTDRLGFSMWYVVHDGRLLAGS